METLSYNVISLYKFFEIKKVFNFKNRLLKALKHLDIKGIILLAPEGININISIKSHECEVFLKDLKKIFDFSNADIKMHSNDSHIYRKFKIKIKKEILTTRNIKNTNPLKKVGKYIQPEDWDKFINKPNTILIDIRNNYETHVGTFKNSLNPNCDNFSSILKWLEVAFINDKNIENKKVAMFCTGGIRCEKASSFLISLGKVDVYQLHGGIIKYLDKCQESRSWKGECFVFDNRVSLNKKLQKGSFFLCYACRMPLSKEDLSKKEYVKGESCHLCYYKQTENQRKKYKMRNQQRKILNEI